MFALCTFLLFDTSVSPSVNLAIQLSIRLCMYTRGCVGFSIHTLQFALHLGNHYLLFIPYVTPEVNELIQAPKGI